MFHTNPNLETLSEIMSRYWLTPPGGTSDLQSRYPWVAGSTSVSATIHYTTVTKAYPVVAMCACMVL